MDVYRSPALDCVCVVRGSINNDEYFHVQHIARPGETVSSYKHTNRVGGKGANQAVAIVRAGGAVKFYGTIGRDGIWVKEQMGEYGIDVEGIIVSEELTGRAIIQVDEVGENSIVLFPGANHSELHERRFVQTSPDYFPEASHVLLQNEICLRSTLYALRNARGAVTIMNPSPLPPANEIPEFPWGSIDWLIVNEAEARGLYAALPAASNSSGKAAPAAAESTEELISLLSAQPGLENTNIVCTLGGDGVLAFVPGFHRPRTGSGVQSFLRLPAAKVERVVDSTGAGDCFAGYFVAGLMRFGRGAVVGEEIGEGDLARVLKVCVYAAGMSVEKSGTIDGIPTRSQVEERMAAHDQT